MPFDATFLRSCLAAQTIVNTEEAIARHRRQLPIRRLEATQEKGPPVLQGDLFWLWLGPAIAALPVMYRGDPKPRRGRQHATHSHRAK